MPILKKLKEALDETKISYEVYNHALAYTAQEIAAKQHFPGKEMAKVVMLDVDGALVMGVIPGSRKISLEMVRVSLGAKKARLATEDEFISRFPDCEIGAMPPFGNLFGLKVYVDPALRKGKGSERGRSERGPVGKGKGSNLLLTVQRYDIVRLSDKLYFIGGKTCEGGF